MERPWVQVAIDALSIGEAERLARIAIEAGADWIEAGTPLITYEGMRAIRVIADMAEGRPVVADLYSVRVDQMGQRAREIESPSIPRSTAAAATPVSGDGSTCATIERTWAPR